MLKKKAKTWDKPFSEKIAKRVAKIPTGELEQWVDNAIYDVGRCLSSYQRNREQVYLDEAVIGAEALHAVVEELHKRMTRV
jgi:hypothetical protein